MPGYGCDRLCQPASDIVTDTLNSTMIGSVFAEAFQVRPQREVEKAGDSLCSGGSSVNGGPDLTRSHHLSTGLRDNGPF